MVGRDLKRSMLKSGIGLQMPPFGLIVILMLGCLFLQLAWLKLGTSLGLPNLNILVKIKILTDSNFLKFAVDADQWT